MRACCCADVSACPSPCSSDATSGEGLDGDKTRNETWLKFTLINLHVHRTFQVFTRMLFFKVLW